LLLEEIEDVNDAKTAALADQSDAYSDLEERMQDFLDDRIEAMQNENDKVERILNRATNEGKPVDEVLAALRLDWLAGIYVQGNTASFDDKIFDKTVYDNEFDIFTYDIGRGKGHGHRDTSEQPGNDRGQGFVVGRGASGDIANLNGRPVPADGKRGRYDRATQSGEGRAPSNYALGLRSGQADGAYNYNQAADMKLAKTSVSSYGRRGAAPKRPSSRKAPSSRSSRNVRRPSSRRPSSRSRKPSSRSYKPQQSYQRTRQLSKRTSYDDYAPIARGGYQGKGY